MIVALNVLKMIIKKYAKIIFIGLSTHVTEAVLRPGFGKVLKLKKIIPMSLFHRCIRSFSSHVKFASFILANKNVTKFD